MAAETQASSSSREAEVQVGRAGGEVERVVFERGSVHELPPELAALFVGNGSARPTRKKPQAK